MHAIVCPACGTVSEVDDAADAPRCPVCGASLRPMAAASDGVIEVEAEVVGGPPHATPPPPDEDGGPRVYTRVSEGPFGTFRSTTVVMGRDLPGGPNCCGFGCMLFVALLAVIFLRGCMSFF